MIYLFKVINVCLGVIVEVEIDKGNKVYKMVILIMIFILDGYCF